MLPKRRRAAGCQFCVSAFEDYASREHRGYAPPFNPPARRGEGGGVAAPHAHQIRIRDACDFEMPQLNEIAHPRPLEAAEYRAPGALVIDENKLRRLESGDEDVVRRQVTVDVSGAMQPSDFRSERTQHDASRRECRTLQMTHEIKSVDPRGNYDL